MNSQTQSTYDRIVDLLNHAALMSKDVDKITNLKIVEELIINKEPSLLDNFLEEMLAFQMDRSVEVKKYIIHFMAVAGKTDAELLPKIVGSMMMMMSEENVNVVKILVLNMSHVFKAVLKWLIMSHPATDTMVKTWGQALHMIGTVSEFIDSENEGLRSSAIKFLEVVVLALSKPPEDLELIRPSNNKGPVYQDDINLSLIPHDHQMLKADKLELEGRKSFDRLKSYQSSTHISSINLITAMSSMTSIAKLRPTYLGQVVQAFESLHVNLPPTLTKSQVSSVRKQLKMQMLAILRLPAAIDYQSNIAILLTDLGASQSEIVRNMPKPDNSRKRKADDTINNSKKAKIDIMTNAYEGENSMDFEESSPLPPRNQTSSTILVPPIKNIPTLSDNQPIAEEGSKHRSAIDVTANDLLHRLTPNNVTDLVLTSMLVLPEQMPPSFQSTYTPIAAAGTPIQIKHLARLLAAQLTNSRLGKGYEAEEAQRLVDDEPVVESIEDHKQDDEQSIETVLCGAVVSNDQTNEKQAEEEENIPLAPTIQSIRKRGVQFNIEKAFEPMTKEEMASHAKFLSERLLESSDVGIVNESKRIMNVKICSSSKEIRNEYLQRIFSNLKNFWSLAMSLIYDEYINYKTLCRTNDNNNDASLTKEQQKQLDKYEECATSILGEILNRPDLKAENLVQDFIFEIPLVTPSIIQILKDCCLDEAHISTGMLTLKELILKRPLLRQECLTLMLSFSTHNRAEVRQIALRVIRNLYDSSDLKESIEGHAMALLKHLLNPTPPVHLVNVVEEKERVWSDEPIRMCLYLYLALLPANHKLIHELASVYTSSSSEIKRVILRVIETPVKGMGMDSPELLLLVENCPKGAETLVTRVIHILTDKVFPSPELVNKVRDLYQRRVSDVRFLIPVLNGLTKNEVISALPKLIKLNPVVVKEVFNRLLGVNGQESRPSSLSPTELLVTLHTLDPAKADMKAIIKACSLCFAEKSVYTHEVLAGVMQQLMDINPLPTLLMRTVIQSLATYPKLAGYVLNVLQRLITKQVWRNKRVWEGFVKCCQRTKPQSFQVLLQLPPSQLKDAFIICPDIREPLLNHVISLTPHQRAHIPKAIMSVLEKPPTGNPQLTSEQGKLKPNDGEDKGVLQNSPRLMHMRQDTDGYDGGLTSEGEEHVGVPN